MNYNCEYCNYSTNYNSNWYRHKQSKTHKTNILLKSTTNTNINYENVDNKKTNTTDYAMLKLLEEKDKRLEETKNIFEVALQDKNSQIEYLKDTIAKMHNSTDTTGDIAKSSVSTLNYVITNFQSAPRLKQIERSEAEKLFALEFDKVQKVKEFNDNKTKSKKKKCSEKEEMSSEKKEELFVEKILYLYKQKQFVKYVKDIIVPIYKTKDPSEQALWNTDTARLNYLIRDIVGKHPEWISDKKGIKLIEYVIQPITNLLKEMVEKYQKQQFNITQDFIQSIPTIERASKAHKLATSLIDLLKSGDADIDICEELCPEFHLDKNYVTKVIGNKIRKPKKVKT